MKVSPFFSYWWLGVILFSKNSFGIQAPPKIDLDLKSHYRLMEEEKLTTEKLWTVDGDQLNPHLQRWALARHTELMGLTARKISPRMFSASAAGLESSLKGYIRGPGPWYSPSSEFPCVKRSDAEFSTEEGARYAVGAAGRLWVEILKEGKIELALTLKKISAKSEATALSEADRDFRVWLRKRERLWRNKVEGVARQEEWKNYFDQNPGCLPSKTTLGQSSEVKSISSKMEPVPPGSPTQKTRVLARAPVRLWDGLLSVRLGVRIGEKILNGRFLVDSGAPQSILSPTWLENQGIYPAWVELPKEAPRRYSWSGPWSREEGLGLVAQVNQVELGGLDLPLREFILAETEFFGPPENVGYCCDGVLGADFLRLFPMEFVASDPPEILIWPKAEFHLGPEAFWIDVQESQTEGLVSSCRGVPHPRQQEVSLPGVQWATGSDEGFEIQSLWGPFIRALKIRSWNVECGSNVFRASWEPGFMKRKGVGRFPALRLGMPFLSPRNPTFDVPHGRIWFPKEALSVPPEKINETGLDLEFFLEDGERVLRVKKIQKGSLAQSLFNAGLRPGTAIHQLNGNLVEELDFWQVNRYLSGVFGSRVSLQWKTKKGLKIAPLETQ